MLKQNQTRVMRLIRMLDYFNSYFLSYIGIYFNNSEIQKYQTSCVGYQDFIKPYDTFPTLIA